MSITPDSFSTGSKVIKFVETRLEDPLAHRVAATISGAAFHNAFIDRTVYLPRDPEIKTLIDEVKGSFNFSTDRVDGSAVESDFEWVCGIMAFVGLNVRRPRLANAMEKAFEIDPGIKSRAIQEEFGDATHAFWYSIGGESLQSHLRGFARMREVRLATLGLMQVQTHLKNPTLLSESYERVVQAYQAEPTEEETATLTRVNKLIDPKFVHRILEALALRFPYLENTGIIPRSGVVPVDQSDLVNWPSMKTYE